MNFNWLCQYRFETLNGRSYYTSAVDTMWMTKKWTRSNWELLTDFWAVAFPKIQPGDRSWPIRLLFSKKYPILQKWQNLISKFKTEDYLTRFLKMNSLRSRRRKRISPLSRFSPFPAPLPFLRLPRRLKNEIHHRRIIWLEKKDNLIGNFFNCRPKSRLKIISKHRRELKKERKKGR